MDWNSDPNRPVDPPGQPAEKPRSRFLVLVEPLLVLLLALAASLLLGALSFMATAALVEDDPIGVLSGTQRKLDIALTQKDPETPAALDETKDTIRSLFDTDETIVVREGDSGWRLMAWIDGAPPDDRLAALAVELDELGWDGAVPMMTIQPGLLGVAEIPRKMRVYVPPALTLQAMLFVLAAWFMVRWRKPRGFGRVVRPAQAIAWGVVAAVAAFVISTLIGGLLHLTGMEVKEQAWIQALMADRSALLAVMPWLVLVGPVSEEAFFRGYVFRRLWSSAGPYAAYAVSALLFAVIHWHPVGLPVYAVIGLIFCWVYRRTGSLWAPVVGHVVYNGIVVSTPLLLGPGG